DRLSYVPGELRADASSTHSARDSPTPSPRLAHTEPATRRHSARDSPTPRRVAAWVRASRGPGAGLPRRGPGRHDARLEVRHHRDGARGGPRLRAAGRGVAHHLAVDLGVELGQPVVELRSEE